MKRFMAGPDPQAAPKCATRLWVLSDLHLEAVPRPEAFRPPRPDFDVLVVPGDVWGGDIVRALETVARFGGGKPAVFVLGNGEASGSDWQGAWTIARRRSRAFVLSAARSWMMRPSCTVARAV
jgi:hypothetical protein